MFEKKTKPLTVSEARKMTKWGRALRIKKREAATIKHINGNIEVSAMEGDTKCACIFDNRDGWLSIDSMKKILNRYIDMGFDATWELEPAGEYLCYDRYHVVIDWSETND